MSLQSRLMALIVTLICVVVFVVSFVLTSTSLQLTSKQTESDGMTLAQLLSRSAGVMDKVPEDVEQMLSDQMVLSAVFISVLTKSTQDKGIGGIANVQEHLKKIVDDTNISFINITDASGKVVFSTQDNKVGTLFNDVEEKYVKAFQAVLQGKNVSYISPPIEDERFSESKIAAIRLLDGNGVVQVGYDFKLVEDIKKRLGYQKLAEVIAKNEQVQSVWILDKNMNTIATSEQTSSFSKASLSEKDLDYIEKVISSTNAFSFFSKEGLNVLAPIFGKDNTIAGATLIRLDTKSFTEGLTYQVRYAVIIALLSVLLGIIASYYLSKSITSPVQQLIYAASNVETGKFDPDDLDDIGEREDEIGLLSRVFQRMGSEVGQRAERLDALVTVRTKDLQSKTRDVERALEQLKATQTQLVAKEKLASLGQLTSGIAHELKNPLNFVINFAKMNMELAKELGEIIETQKKNIDEKEVSYVEDLLKDLTGNSDIISNHGKHAEKIIESMIQHSHGGSTERQDVSYFDFMAKNMKLLEPVLQSKNHDFSFALTINYDAKDDVELNIMPQEVKRVLQYLLDNAFDAIFERSQSGEEGYKPEISVKMWKDKKHAYVAIHDNGVGIPEENMNKVFNPFFTTKPTRKGNTGMGLSLSYDIIAQQHNGNIGLESKVGEGSTFTIAIPLH